MRESVLMKGGGLAACCCATLLDKSGYRVIADLPTRAASPMLMLSEQTQRLLLDVFGIGDLFDGSVPIRKRVVLWGESKDALVLPHAGLAISESVLLNHLYSRWTIERDQNQDQAIWSVISSATALPAATRHAFGSRIASTHSIELQATSPNDCCWVESVPGGWLFLIPCGDRNGSLIAVGAAAQLLLAQSTLVADQIADLGASTGSFPAYPRIATPLCGAGWIACGSAAIAFDPIAGEGAGNALREGILASAVIRASQQMDEEQNLLAHYSNRLLKGFLRHLQECCNFYEPVSGPWWEAELASLRQGIVWARQQLDVGTTDRFRLLGFELQRCL